MLARNDWLPPEPPPFQPQREPVPLWRDRDMIGGILLFCLVCGAVFLIRALV